MQIDVLSWGLGFVTGLVWYVSFRICTPMLEAQLARWERVVAVWGLEGGDDGSS